MDVTVKTVENTDKEGTSLDEQFQFCERVIDDNESGTFSTKEMQGRLKECKEKLENLTREVCARDLFSKNETVEDIPTASLQYLLLPSYLATAIQNIIVEPEQRVEALDQAKIYLRDFLERLLSYEIIGFVLPWLKEDEDAEEVQTKMRSKPDPAEVRTKKLQRHQQKKEMESNLEKLKAERSLNSDDDSVLRELLMTRLRLFALKAFSELEQIDEERPLAEHMMRIRSGEISHSKEAKKPVPSKPPIIITRDALQKKVFGLGYPSIPTLTVDEWYNDMMKHGRFGDMQKGPSNQQNALENDDEDDEKTEDERRARAQQWDEYKDNDDLPVGPKCIRLENDDRSDVENTKKRKWDIWSDVIQERSITEGVSTGLSIESESAKINRGAESYEKPAHQINNAHFDADTRSGLEERPLLNYGDDLFSDACMDGTDKPNTSKNMDKRCQRQAHKGNKMRKSAFGRGAERGRKRGWNESNGSNPNLVSCNYSLDALKAAHIPNGLNIDELGERISKALGERDGQTIGAAVKAIGETLALKLFEETRKVELSGGMLVLDGSRRRTPGGVFMVLFKANPDIPQEAKVFTFQDKLNELQKDSKFKKKPKRRLHSSKNDYELKVLPNAADAIAVACESSKETKAIDALMDDDRSSQLFRKMASVKKDNKTDMYSQSDSDNSDGNSLEDSKQHADAIDESSLENEIQKLLSRRESKNNDARIRYLQWQREQKEAEEEAKQFEAYWKRRHQEDQDLWRDKDFANAIDKMSRAGYKGEYGNFDVPEENIQQLNALYMQATSGNYDGNHRLKCADQWKMLNGWCWSLNELLSFSSVDHIRIEQENCVFCCFSKTNTTSSIVFVLEKSG
ncbi:unnamed protein product [Anisakis simplex]|uniref:RNA_GG_bind domain-containing protein n=1 Tax=Anisakis simplex TaxID=6269 RepID=A0A0M3JXF5_ANISI|nr:unnamed protein product [Anisakis simplex]